jgi:hypothetical protein
MLIGGLELRGNVINASGARGFDGKPYPFPHPGGLVDWTSSVLGLKTATWSSREGFMPLHGLTPKERVPRCIIVKPWGGHVLNCVGLSNPGVVALHEMGVVQALEEPFVYSFMAVGSTREERMGEWRSFLEFMVARLHEFRARFIIKVNIACPNVNHNVRHLVNEVREMLDTAHSFGFKVIICINLLVMPEEAVEISRHSACAAVLQANSVPWGAFPDRIPWKKIFGSDVSPLVARGFGPGGYSGPYEFPILVDWVKRARNLCQDCRWLIAGGGIQSVDDAEEVLRTGYPMLHGLSLGVVSIVRPWRVQPIIQFTNRFFGSHPPPKSSVSGSSTPQNGATGI